MGALRVQGFGVPGFMFWGLPRGGMMNERSPGWLKSQNQEQVFSVPVLAERQTVTGPCVGRAIVLFLAPYSAALTRHQLCLLGFSSLSSLLLLLSMLGSVGRSGRTGNSVSSRSALSSRLLHEVYSGRGGCRVAGGGTTLVEDFESVSHDAYFRRSNTAAKATNCIAWHYDLSASSYDLAFASFWHYSRPKGKHRNRVCKVHDRQCYASVHGGT